VLLHFGTNEIVIVFTDSFGQFGQTRYIFRQQPLVEFIGCTFETGFMLMEKVQDGMKHVWNRSFRITKAAGIVLLAGMKRSTGSLLESSTSETLKYKKRRRWS
jgi:hypothetical protein